MKVVSPGLLRAKFDDLGVGQLFVATIESPQPQVFLKVRRQDGRFEAVLLGPPAGPRRGICQVVEGSIIDQFGPAIALSDLWILHPRWTLPDLQRSQHNRTAGQLLVGEAGLILVVDRLESGRSPQLEFVDLTNGVLLARQEVPQTTAMIGSWAIITEPDGEQLVTFPAQPPSPKAT